MDLSENSDHTHSKSQTNPTEKESSKEEKITTPVYLADNRINEKRSAVENLIQDVKTQRGDIDRLNQSVTYMADKLTQIAQIMDNQTKVLNTLSSGGGEVQGVQDDKMAQLEHIGTLAEKVVGIWRSTKDPPAATALISQESIQAEMVSSYMDNLNTGKAINNFVKDALKKKVTREVVNSTLSELGKAEHGPS